MSKRKTRKYGVSRRLGVNLWGREKDPTNNERNYPPGAHGLTGYKKLTDYGIQLQAKQRLRRYYGDVTEKQFHRTYERALQKKGDTGENLDGLLESRLDAFIYRAMLVPTIFAARQMVNHKHFKVNGRAVNIPSYSLKAGDVVEVRDSSKQLAIIQNAIGGKDRVIPGYIEMDKSKLVAKFVKSPILADVPYPNKMEPHLVIEFYSR